MYCNKTQHTNNTHHTNNTPHSNKHGTQNYTNNKGHTTHNESWVYAWAHRSMPVQIIYFVKLKYSGIFYRFCLRVTVESVSDVPVPASCIRVHHDWSVFLSLKMRKLFFWNIGNLLRCSTVSELKRNLDKNCSWIALTLWNLTLKLICFVPLSRT
jgi:hypothetical protein